MKSLPFTPKRVRFQVGPGLWQGGITEGHFVTMERAWFDKKPSWVRYYAVRVITGPSSLRGAVVRWQAEFVLPWAALSDSPGEYDPSAVS